MRRRSKSRTKNKSFPLFLVLLLAGIEILLYPAASNWWNGMHMSQAISNYQSAVSELEEMDKQKYLEEAVNYNEEIASREDAYVPSKHEREVYEDILNVNGDGVMGHVQIPKIDVDLPIYHGTEEKILQIGAGHVEWSALPVGGEGTHCVISGHTGLPTSKLFTDLDELEEGDIFYLNILGEKYAYEVDRIVVVLPEEVEYLLPEEGEDYCTLMTCTPYGINTHRLLVRGRRTTVPEEAKATVTEDNDSLSWWILVSAIVVLILANLAILVRHSKKKNKEKSDKKGAEEKNEKNI